MLQLAVDAVLIVSMVFVLWLEVRTQTQLRKAFPMTALSELQAAVGAQGAQLATAVSILQSIPGLISAAGGNDDVLSTLTSSITAQTEALTAGIAASGQGAPAALLVVNPTSITGTVGSGISQTLTVSGGVAPYSFSSSLSDLAVDASGGVNGTPTAAETGSIVISDSASPPASVTVSVIIS